MGNAPNAQSISPQRFIFKTCDSEVTESICIKFQVCGTSGTKICSQWPCGLGTAFKFGVRDPEAKAYQTYFKVHGARTTGSRCTGSPCQGR